MAEEKAHKQSFLLKLIFSFFMLLVFIIVSEISLRIIDINFYQKNQFFPINRDIDFPEVYEKDSDLFWRFRPSQTIDSRAFSHLSYEINSFGLRGAECEKEKNGIRIVALGNSCTFGWGVAQDKIWVELTENSLSQFLNLNVVEVLNGGVPGYSSFQGKNYFSKELIKLNPDMITIMYGWNDMWTAGKDISDAEQQMPGGFILWWQNQLSKMKFYQLIRKVLLSLTENEEVVPLDQMAGKRRVSPDEYFNNLREIIQLAKQNNIKVLVLIPPIASLENYYSGMDSRYHKFHKIYQEKAKAAASYEQVAYLDLQEIFDNYNDLYDYPKEDPIHFNSKGHDLTAAEVSKKIIEQFGF